MFDEARFPFTTLPLLTNDSEFLFEMDLMISPIGTCLGVGTLTPCGCLTAPLGGLTARVEEAGSLTACVVEADSPLAPQQLRLRLPCHNRP
jgi:hypothetical protein